MPKTLHVSLDIRGYLAGVSDAELAKVFVQDGVPVPAREARLYLLDQLSLGRKQLPVGPMCEGFSFEKGCPGHEA